MVPIRYIVGPPFPVICIAVSMRGYMIFVKIQALSPNMVELEEHLRDGWLFVAKVSERKVVVRRGR